MLELEWYEDIRNEVICLIVHTAHVGIYESSLRDCCRSKGRKTGQVVVAIIFPKSLVKASASGPEPTCGEMVFFEEGDRSAG